MRTEDATTQMSGFESMSATYPKFCALPDEVLRAMAAFVPLSGLIALVQCNQRLAGNFRGKLTCRLDNLFVAVAPQSPSVPAAFLFWGRAFPLEINRGELQALFGDSRAYTLGAISFDGYCFVEANKGYRYLLCTQYPAWIERSTDCFVKYMVDDTCAVPEDHFIGWLQHRQRQLDLLLSETSRKAAGVIRDVNFDEKDANSCKYLWPED